MINTDQLYQKMASADLQQRFETCEKCRRSYTDKFQDVEVISAVDADSLSDIILVDVRSKEEQELSMIEGVLL